MTPKRIQVRRTKGWRMPADAVYVGRPTRWGNPFVAGHRIAVSGVQAGAQAGCYDADDLRDYVLSLDTGLTAEQAVALFRVSLLDAVEAEDSDVAQALARLRGHDLACWCPLDRPCHADVLLDLANPTLDLRDRKVEPQSEAR